MLEKRALCYQKYCPLTRYLLLLQGKASHNHGNVGWGNKVVSNLRGTSLAKGAGEGNHLRKLKRLLPYA